jgi:hypothetical protein
LGRHCEEFVASTHLIPRLTIINFVAVACVYLGNTAHCTRTTARARAHDRQLQAILGRERPPLSARQAGTQEPPHPNRAKGQARHAGAHLRLRQRGFAHSLAISISFSILLSFSFFLFLTRVAQEGRTLCSTCCSWCYPSATPATRPSRRHRPSSRAFCRRSTRPSCGSGTTPACSLPLVAYVFIIIILGLTHQTRLSQRELRPPRQLPLRRGQGELKCSKPPQKLCQ